MERFLLDGMESERLYFRKLDPKDFDSWLPFYEDPESTRFWEGIPQDPIKACQEQFARAFERYEKGLGGMNALVLKSSGDLVGICGLLIQVVDGEQELEIGYSLLPNFRKRGFALEAASKCKSHAFEQKFAQSLISIIHVDNLPSQNVALKNGMRKEKTTTYKGNPVDIFRVRASHLVKTK